MMAVSNSNLTKAVITSVLSEECPVETVENVIQRPLIDALIVFFVHNILDTLDT